MSLEGRERGFALLDSVVALAIVAFAIPILLWGLGASSRRLADDKLNMSLLNLADRKLTEATAAFGGAGESLSGTEGQLAWRVSSSIVSKGEEATSHPDPNRIALVEVTSDAYIERLPEHPHVVLTTLLVGGRP